MQLNQYFNQCMEKTKGKGAEEAKEVEEVEAEVESISRGRGVDRES